MNSLHQFLQLAACPNCRSKLKHEHDLICIECGSLYPFDRDGIPQFFQGDARIKFENPEFADLYAACWCYGYQIFHAGGTESLYRAVNEMAFTALDRNGRYNILEVGCGAGRNVGDYARFFHASLIVGLDISRVMLSRAQRIVVGDKQVSFNLSHLGFGQPSMKGFGLDNAFFVRGTIGKLPFNLEASPNFDVIVSVSSIDCFNDPLLEIPVDTIIAFKSILRLLKPGGLLILATSLSWINDSDWQRWPTRQRFMDWLVTCGLKLDEWYDDVVVREIKDANGSYNDWPMLVLRGVKL